MNAPSSPRSERTLLHLGLGSFHRAHQAVYLHRLRESGDRSWAIVAGNIRADMEATAAALAAQRGAYTLETVTPAGERHYERITSIREVVPWEPTLARLVEVGAEASTGIISFTVTEAGYYLDAHDRLDRSHPDVQADLAGRRARRSMAPWRRSSARAARRGGCRHLAELRQPAQQRHALSRRAARLPRRPRRNARCGEWSETQRPARARWSTASRRARRRMSPSG